MGWSDCLLAMMMSSSNSSLASVNVDGSNAFSLWSLATGLLLPICLLWFRKYRNRNVSLTSADMDVDDDGDEQPTTSKRGKK